MPYADLDERGIWVQTQPTEKDLIKQVPGSRFDPAAKLWRVPRTWTSMVVMRAVFGPSLTYSQAIADWVWSDRQNRVDPSMLLRDQDTGDELVSNYVGTDRLFPYQEAGARWLLQAGSGILGDDMGLGKTVEVLAAMHVADKLGWTPLPALVICPNSVKPAWERATPKWFPGATPYMVPNGTVKGRKVLAQAALDPTALVIVHYEAVRSFSRLAPYGSIKLIRCRECDKKFGTEDLPSHRCQVHRKELNGFGFRFAVLDEAHLIADPKAQRTRAIWATLHDPSVVLRWAMTGTPIQNHPGDLWSLLHAVAPQDFPTKGQYLERYALYEWNVFAGQDIVGIKPETRAEFFRILDPRFRRMTQPRVQSQLPPKTYSTRWVDLSAAQRKAYDELKKGLTTTIDGERLTAQNHLVAATRLMQFTAGTVIVEDKPDPDDVSTWIIKITEPSPKLDVFEEVLTELDVPDRGVPVVVAAEYHDLINLAAARLTKRGIAHGVLTGRTPHAERQHLLDELQTGRLPVLLFTTSAGGVGVDMYAADTLINLQRSWKMVNEIQKEARVYRIGSERHDRVQIIDLVVRDSIEGTQIERFYIKRERLEQITRDRLSAPADTVAKLDAEEAALLSGNPTRLEEFLR